MPMRKHKITTATNNVSAIVLLPGDYLTAKSRVNLLTLAAKSNF